MSFKKRVTKSIALALVGVTIAIPMLNTASAMENSKETYSQKIERVSKSFEDFVYLEDNQYKLDISVSELSESSKSDFYIYNDYINLLNNIIVSNNIKNVTEDGFSLQISDEMAIESAKINNIDLFKVKDNENTYYGFSQEWYKDEWQRRAGCGATVASSIINYYNY